VLGLVLSLVVWSANLNSLSLPNGVSLAMRLNWRQLAASSPPATDRILVAGDALAASLATGLPRDLHDTTSVSHAALTNCGLAGGDVVIGDAHYTSSGCENWRGVYATAVDDFRPRTAIFLTGVKEVFDRQVGNRTLRVGTTEYERYLVDRLEVARRTLTKRGARFVLVGAPCMQPFASANAPDVFAVVRNDARRIAWLNQVLERYANREKISFVDIATMLCANSRRQDPQAIATALTSTESSKVWTRLLR
jgi:hypothetical protein